MLLSFRCIRIDHKGHALFRSVKSTHILHFSLAFFTNTRYTRHLGYLISLMWTTTNSLRVSSRMMRHLSSLNFLLLWAMGLTLSSMVCRWHRKSRSIPSISADYHVKAPLFSNITSVILSLSSFSNEVSSLNFFSFTSLSRTSPASPGRLSLMASTSAIHPGSPAWIVIA